MPGKVKPEGELPVTQWRETHRRFALHFSAFASDGGAFERVEIVNPFREARELAFTAEVNLPDDAGRVRMDGAVLRGAGGEALVAFSGAEELRAHLPRSNGDAAGVDFRVVLPPLGRRVVEVALGFPGGRARPRGFTHELNAAHARWDSVLGALGTATIPDESLAAAFAQALPALVGPLTPSVSQPDNLWPTPGFPPAVGPATLDAVAFRALDLWGGAEFVDSCLASAFAAQGTAAPPGEYFRRAEGYLSAPPEGETGERWASDCGALLWAASVRRDVGVPTRTFREARPHLIAACEWIMGELASNGLMSPARAPKDLKAAGRAWTDGWSWRGLDAAATALGRLGDRSAKRISRVASAYRDRIIAEWEADPLARGCLETLQVLEQVVERDVERDEASSRARSRELAALAASLASEKLTPHAELNEAAVFLLSLRKLLLDDTGEVLRLFPGAPAEWFEGGQTPGFERLPTRFGPVSVRAISTRSARRVIVEVDLPKLPRDAMVELCIGPPDGTLIKEVRVDGKRTSRFKPRAGTIELPPRRVLEVVAELSG